MKRVVHNRDPWSGQVSLPGGRKSPEDPNLLVTAIRETREEVDVDLGVSARLLGKLAPRQAFGRGVRQDLDVTPFVFRLEQEVSPVPLEEAEALFWLPLEQALIGELDGIHHFDRKGSRHRLPCWKIDGFVVWGMTYRILTNLFSICGAIQTAPKDEDQP